MVQNSPCYSVTTGSIPDWGAKVPHAVQLLSLCAQEPALTTARKSVPLKERAYVMQQRSCVLQLRLEAVK